MTKNTTVSSCIDDCLRCYQASLESIRNCIRLGGEHATNEHISANILSAKACPESHALLMQKADDHKSECQDCDETCHSCLEDCQSKSSVYDICRVACYDCQSVCQPVAA